MSRHLLRSSEVFSLLHCSINQELEFRYNFLIFSISLGIEQQSLRVWKVLFSSTSHSIIQKYVAITCQVKCLLNVSNFLSETNFALSIRRKYWREAACPLCLENIYFLGLKKATTFTVMGSWEENEI